MLTKKAGTKPAVQTPKKVACQSLQLAYALKVQRSLTAKQATNENARPAK